MIICCIESKRKLITTKWKLLKILRQRKKEFSRKKKEIWGQPDLWLKVYEKIRKEKHTLSTYINSVLAEHTLTVILTGAGTSAYIGLSLTGTFTRNFRKHTLAIPTTDLVTHPTDYFSPDQSVLLISFARSGNSPESVAAARLADQLCSKVHHIIITCNSKGLSWQITTPNPQNTCLFFRKKPTIKAWQWQRAIRACCLPDFYLPGLVK